jgi:hypothetical protein
MPCHRFVIFLLRPQPQPAKTVINETLCQYIFQAKNVSAIFVFPDHYYGGLIGYYKFQAKEKL